MKRTSVPLLTVIVLAASAAMPIQAQEFRCKESAGCLAQIPENGELRTVAFRRGDLISTEDGWIVDPDNGWKKIRSTVDRVDS